MYKLKKISKGVSMEAAIEAIASVMNDGVTIEKAVAAARTGLKKAKSTRVAWMMLRQKVNAALKRGDAEVIELCKKAGIITNSMKR